MEEKTLHYLKYAFGEVVLVVIGILIALQINAWDDNKRDFFDHQFHLAKLRTSLVTDAKALQQKIKINENVIKSLQFCIEALKTESTVSKKEFFKQYQFMSADIRFNQHRSSFDSMVTTGKISLIEDQNLLNGLFNYYDDTEYLKVDAGLSNFTNNVVAPYVFEYDAIPKLDQSQYDEFDLSKYSFPNKSMEDYKKNVFILNVIRVKLLYTVTQKQRYSELLAETAILLSMIAVELTE